MKKIFTLTLFSLLSLSLFADDISTCKELINRLIPQFSSSFVVEKLPNTKQDCFKLSSRDGKIIIAGNNANSMASGLNYYLKYYCNTTISWYVDDSISMPMKLVEVEEPITIKARCENRFFLNYCTFGYTMPWWNWRDWEHFIDWMALNGINLPLAITGQESIWYKVWTKLGLSDEQVRHYFTGPAHLPWHRMMNMDYFQGDLPMSWLDDQEELQKKIVTRERAFNMKPVLPAFSGHVPQEIKTIYPEAKITKLGAWAGSNEYRSSFLDPMDPLFSKIQKEFLTQQNKIYGTDHIYGIDLFNEMDPPSFELPYLKRVGHQVYGTLKKVDKKAVWLQMTWLFYNERKDWTNERIKTYIKSYPAKNSILLDYYCDRREVWKQTDKYFGVPYIWCYLGNFGGNTMLAGNIIEVNKRIENTVKNGGKNFKGLGSTLEGFDCNPFMYEYVFEKAWDFDTHKDVSKWTEHIADEHAGKVDINERAAWDMLINKIYIKAASPGQSPVLTIRPSMYKFSTYYCRPKIPYNNKELLAATNLMLHADSKTAAYTFDVVNLTRQVLSNYFSDVFNEYKEAYKAGDYGKMKSKEFIMLDLINDVDRLVSTQSTFLVGKWIKEARAKGINEEEKTYYEQNARTLLTTWVGKAKGLNDYASRTWSGMVKTFYGARWRMFFASVDKAVIAGEKYDEAKDKEYQKEVQEYEQMWWKNCVGNFSSLPKGDGIAISKELISKYAPMIESL